jgi:type IV pilus assembly protein PilC
MARANPGTRRGAAAQRIADSLSSGKTLSQIIAEDGTFPLGAADALAAGEHSGRLEAVLEYLSASARTETDFRLSIIHAVAYPVVIAVAGLAVGIFIQVRILPLFRQMYQDMDLELPEVTKAMLGGFVINAFLVLTLPAFLLVLLYVVPPRLVPFRGLCDSVRLRLPLLGEVLRRFLLARWCGAMALLVRAGVPEPQAVRLAGRSTGHVGVEAQSKWLSGELEKGRPLAEAMEERPFFPPPLVWMVGSSQRLGGHAPIWPAARELYQAQGERLSFVVSIVLRVLFIVLAFMMVGVTVSAMFLPLIKLMRALGG